ncbi:MAG: hypothetical protein R6U17_06060 [Thermoplasmata archaeon]
MECSNMLVKEKELRELESFPGDWDELYHDFLPEEIVNQSGRTVGLR